MIRITRRTLIATAAAGFSGFLAFRALGAPGERLIVLGGDLTEIVFALGAGARVIAVDSTSKYPAAAAALPDVGYVRRLTPEGLLSLAPTRVIAAHDAGPESALDKLRAARIEVLRGPEAEGAEGIGAKITFIGAALGLEAEAEGLAARTEAALEAAGPATPSGARAAILMAGRDGALMAAGAGTSAQEMLELAGARNVFAVFDGFKPVSAEAMIGAAPDVILVPDHVLEGIGGVAGLRARPEIAATPAGKAGRIVAMDAMLLLGFGPRTPLAVRELAGALGRAR